VRQPLGGWAALRKDAVEVMISLPNAHEPFEKPTLTGSLYFSSDNVDALWEKIKDKATIVYPIENFYYGMREFAVRDNNGYILQFGQEITDRRRYRSRRMIRLVSQGRIICSRTEVLKYRVG